mmetsp:Transcript_11109/g.21773  ORF Transcript_11109/g.21773 Transcript_11109/m.21773 type:complete len:301 (-) Transcript_11109:1616-2518(-)
MSNIRTLADLNKQSSAPERARLNPTSSTNLETAPLMGYGAAQGASPDRQNKVWDIIKANCCPYFSVRSFIFAITILDIVCYCASVAFEHEHGSFFKPSTRSLDYLGGKDAYKMQRAFQLWRWHTPMFLHVDLFHLGYNCIMQLILGFRLEPTVGLWRTIVVYVIAGIGGLLMSCLFSPNILTVGASCAIFGILGAMLGWILMNWEALGEGPNKIFTLLWLGILLIINLVIGFSNATTDNWGHIGGLLTGFCLAPVLLQFLDNTKQSKKIWQIAGGAALSVYMIVGFTVFYTEVHTERLYY